MVAGAAGEDFAAARDDDLERLLLLTVDDSNDLLQAWQLKSLARMLDRLKTRGWSIADQVASASNRDQIAAAFMIARRMVSDPAEHEVRRIAAIPLLLRDAAMADDEAMLKMTNTMMAIMMNMVV